MGKTIEVWDKIISIKVLKQINTEKYSVEFIGFKDEFDKIGALADTLVNTAEQYGISPDVVKQKVETALAIAETCHRKGEDK